MFLSKFPIADIGKLIPKPAHPIGKREMTLLSICQSACATAAVAVPTAIVGNTDETAILMLALANDAGDELARRPQGGWISMIRGTTS